MKGITVNWKCLLGLLYSFLLGMYVYSQPVRLNFQDLPKPSSTMYPILTELKGLIPQNKLPKGTEGNFHELFSNDSGYFATIDGTGYLFEIRENAGKQDFVRIDSTFFTGYNYDNIKFTWNNRFFSYGGYGFWKHNGLVRMYNNQSCQWELLLLEKEIPAISSKTATWLDKKNGHLYVYNPSALNDGLIPVKVNVDSMHLQVWRISLSTGACNYLGKGSELNFSKLAESPWGILCNFNNKELGLLDFKNNKIRHLNLEANKRYLIASTQVSPDIKFFVDSTLYLVNSKSGSIQTLSFVQHDFESTNRSLYEIYETEVPVFWIGLAIGLCLLFTIGIFLRKRTLKISVQSEEAQFSYQELNLIRLFLSKQVLNEGVSIDDLNQHLGIKLKSDSVQKKIRSESLNSLNHTLKLQLNTKEDVIIKERTETDKRSFIYLLNPAFLQTLRNSIDPV